MDARLLLNRITDSKTIYSAFGIIIIVLCHLAVVDSTMPFVRIFSPGFIGVDIFLFYSGYTLGYSYTKRSARHFFIQRIKRIFPMFLVFAILFTLINIAKGRSLTMFDWFCNLTTLSYYGIGGFAIDWYLSSIFLFYLTFPMFYTFLNKIGMGGWFL